MLPGLTPIQAGFVHEHLGATELVRDMGWHQVDTQVLHVRAAGDRDVVVKAASAPQGRHHLVRELRAHLGGAVAPLVALQRAGKMVAGDADTGVLVLEYQPGTLVEGTEAERDPRVHEEAGRLLRVVHAHPAPDGEWAALANSRALRWLDTTPHRLKNAHAAAARRILQAEGGAGAGPPVEIVHTHGDWQPRNWQLEAGRLHIIDWGRYERRPAYTDLVRCAAQQWREDPALADAFVRGYGSDPRLDVGWKIECLRQAVGTACWARQVGDEAFEAQGFEMVREALKALGECVD